MTLARKDLPLLKRDRALEGGAARKGGATLNQRFFALVALDRDRGERQAVRDHLNHPNVPCSQIDGHVGGLDRVDHLFGRGERVKSVQ